MVKRVGKGAAPRRLGSELIERDELHAVVEELIPQGEHKEPAPQDQANQVTEVAARLREAIGNIENEEQRQAVHAAYDAALASQVVVRESYMGSCADEYWAEGVQAWFQASARVDVNEGMLTRAQLKRRDPRLAHCLAATFGDGEASWNYTSELSSPTRERWMRRQVLYLIMRQLLLHQPDVLADFLERLLGRPQI